mmetsp:Transcript_14164/g.40508  ORF Transcript_14164/g.40508 Transcript_14164/m.40508 type:complete len:287 (+) Transcript_14164:2577-3437(+)
MCDPHGLVGGDEDPALCRGYADGLFPLFLVHLVHDAHAEGWVPEVQLAAPLRDQRGRGHDEDAATVGGGGHTQGEVLHAHVLQDAGVVQHSQVRRNLHRLAQAHLVRQDPAQLLLLKSPEPLDACVLVGIEGLPEPARAAQALGDLDIIMKPAAHVSLICPVRTFLLLWPHCASFVHLLLRHQCCTGLSPLLLPHRLPLVECPVAGVALPANLGLGVGLLLAALLALHAGPHLHEVLVRGDRLALLHERLPFSRVCLLPPIGVLRPCRHQLVHVDAVLLASAAGCW